MFDMVVRFILFLLSMLSRMSQVNEMGAGRGNGQSISPGTCPVIEGCDRL